VNVKMYHHMPSASFLPACLQECHFILKQADIFLNTIKYKKG